MSSFEKMSWESGKNVFFRKFWIFSHIWLTGAKIMLKSWFCGICRFMAKSKLKNIDDALVIETLIFTVLRPKLKQNFASD